ncbi:MAG: hypothetical protein ACXADW_21080 [Candidatus Hodarchaeales archaeon]
METKKEANGEVSSPYNAESIKIITKEPKKAIKTTITAIKNGLFRPPLLLIPYHRWERCYVSIQLISYKNNGLLDGRG